MQLFLISECMTVILFEADFSLSLCSSIYRRRRVNNMKISVVGRFPHLLVSRDDGEGSSPWH